MLDKKKMSWNYWNNSYERRVVQEIAELARVAVPVDLLKEFRVVLKSEGELVHKLMYSVQKLEQDWRFLVVFFLGKPFIK